MLFWQEPNNTILVEVVDSSMQPIGCMPYAEVLVQKHLYVNIVGFFLYNNSVLLSKNSSLLWNATVQMPLQWKKGVEETLCLYMAETIGIKGVKVKQLHIEKPSSVQSYFLKIYAITVPYTLHTKWDSNNRRFVQKSLLQQSIILEPKVFDPILIKTMQYME